MEQNKNKFAESGNILPDIHWESRRGLQEIRELELKKSMLNFKIISLMKKQLFSLVMMLALIVMAGTSAWAQSDDALNQSTVTYTMITGSTHTFTITRGRAGTTLDWEVYEGINTVTSAAADFTITGGNTNPTFTITWLESATLGSYTIQVTESNLAANGGCSTVRRFYVRLIDFDVLVYASDAAGLELTTPAQLATCGDGSTANYGNEAAGGAFNNVFNTDGDLNPYVGLPADDRSAATKGYTERFITVAVRWSASTPLADIPAIGSVRFNYTASVAPASPTLLLNINGAAGTENAPTAIQLSAALGTKPATPPAGLTTDAYSVYYVVPMTFADRWFGASVSADIASTFYAGGVNLYDGAPTPALIGTEPVAKETAPLINTSTTQTIYLAPATTTISVN